MYYAVVSLAIMGGIFGLVLAFASKKFAVEVDPRVEAINEALPGANCGACGYPGCSGLAEAIAEGKAPVDACVPGKEAVAKKVAEIMGVEANADKERSIAQLMCQGGNDKCKNIYEGMGFEDCHSAVAHFKGPKACNYGCLGFGSCEKICPFGAIKMGDNGLPIIDPYLCTGCGKCVQNCPQQVLKLVGVSHLVHVRCSNKDKGKFAKQACSVACIKCRLCEKNCPQDAIHVVSDEQGGSVAVIDYEKCTNCGICATKCPTKAIEKILPIDNTVPPKTVEPEDTTNSNCGACGLCK